MRRLMSLIVLLALLAVAAALAFDRRGVQEYWWHLTETRPALDLPFEQISQDWTEADLRARFPDLAWRCMSSAAHASLGNRGCYADISAHNGLSAMAVAFHLREGRVHHAVVHHPSWVHKRMLRDLRQRHGRPHATQRLRVQGVRLTGWKLPNGSLFANHNVPDNPLKPNTTMWSSPRACTERPCWTSQFEPLEEENDS